MSSPTCSNWMSVPTGLVSEEDQARLEETVEILKGIARDVQLSGAS